MENEMFTKTEPRVFSVSTASEKKSKTQWQAKKNVERRQESRGKHLHCSASGTKRKHKRMRAADAKFTRPNNKKKKKKG